FDLVRAVQDLKSEGILERDGHNAIILHKEAGLKVVLVALRKGYRLYPHKAEVPIIVHVLEGEIQFGVKDETVQAARENPLALRANMLVTLHAGLVHELHAVENSVFLLTMAGFAERSFDAGPNSAR
ncbi:MAG: hypothetical protein KGI84_05465, partial [Elusimicrobia bacterium]|nr:hypothetical protein [Elusimicrobiota bacterium]